MGSICLEAGSYRFEDPVAGPAFALDYKIRSYSRKDGFPALQTAAITRGLDGFFWMGTDQGLYRFDGREFRFFGNHTEDGQRWAIAIDHLLSDEEGVLWIGTEEGLRVFEQGVIRSPADARLASAEISAMELARDGGIWIGCDSGLYRLTPETVQHWGKAEGLAESTVVSLAETQEGDVLVGTSKGVQWLHHQSGEISSRGLPFRPFEGVDGAAVSMAAAGDLLVTESGAIFALFGLLRPDSFALHRWQGKQWRRVYADGLPIEGHELVADTDEPDAIWITGAAEFKRLDMGTETIRTFRPPQLVKSDYILTLFAPSLDSFSVGLLDKGFLVGQQKLHMELQVNKQLRPGDVIRSLAGRESGSFLVGADTGIYYEDGQRVSPEGDTDLVEKNVVRSVLIGADGAQWKGTKNGLFRKAPGKREWKFLDLDGRLLGQSTEVLFEDSRGRLWIGTSMGAVVLDQELKVHAIDLNLEDEEAVVRGVGERASGDIWMLVLERGVYRVGEDYSIVDHIGAEDGLSVMGLTSLLVGETDRLWFGGEKGLSVWYGGAEHSFAGFEEVPAQVDLVYRDRSGLLWLGHADGLIVMPARDLLERLENREVAVRSRFFGEKTDVPMGAVFGAFSQPTVYEGTDGKVWFCAENGVFGFDSRRLHESLDLRVSSVVVNEVIVDGQALISAGEARAAGVVEGVSTVGTIRLLELGFVAPSTVYTDAVRYRCQLEGYDEDWIPVSSDARVRYTNLEPGDYRILVKASYPYSGDWTHAAPVALAVVPEYYSTLWFRSVVCLGLGAIICSVYWWRARFVRRIFELEKVATVYREKQRISQNLHDDLGAEVTKLMMMIRNFRRQPPTNQGSDERIDAALAQAKRVGWQVRQTVWDVSPEPVSVSAFIAKLEMELGEQTQHADFDLVLSRERIDGTLLMAVDTSQNLLAMTKEIGANTAKHSEATQLGFSASLHDSKLSLSFSDDGQGFDIDKQVAGHGIANLRRRAASLGATLTIQSRPSVGCRISIVLDLDDKQH